MLLIRPKQDECLPNQTQIDLLPNFVIDWLEGWAPEFSSYEFKRGEESALRKQTEDFLRIFN